MTALTMAKALNAGLRRALEADPKVVIAGQDVGKLIVAAGIIVGAAAATFVSLTGSPTIRSLLDYFIQRMLT